MIENNHQSNLSTSGSLQIELHRVVKNYPVAVGVYPALREVSLFVAPGEFIAIVGKSGSGKSTLLNMLTGIDRPTSGEIFIGGANLCSLNESRLAAWRGRNVGIVFQFFQLLPTLTILENVMLPMDFCGSIQPASRKSRAMQLLEKTDLREQANKLPSALSGGQQQRAAIARALANDPPLLVADEPTGNLDSTTAASVFRLFEALVSQGKTVVIVTHDRDFAARVGRIVTLADGQIVEDNRLENAEQLAGKAVLHA